MFCDWLPIRRQHFNFGYILTMTHPSTSNHNNRGVLLANLGSPAAPTPNDVRAYLDEFLMDPRVMDMPYPLRWFIVKRLILPKRPIQSAHAYQRIWWDEGSPLIVLTERVRAKLAAQLDMPVVTAMRYGHPSIRSGLAALLEKIDSAGEIILFPMYPHYAMSTYETLVLKTLSELEKLVGAEVTADYAAQYWLRDAVGRVQRRMFSRRVGGYTLSIVPPHYEHPAYISALANSVRANGGDFDHLLFSYHGIPERHLRKTAPRGSKCLREDCCMTREGQYSVSSDQYAVISDTQAVCYRHQVFMTTHLVAQKLNLSPRQYSVSFQSRLGRDKWLNPYTAEELVRLARAGVKRLAVITPSFTVDCLETLEEIGMEGREIFLDAGGEDFQLIPCLNDNDDWVRAMAGMVDMTLAE